MSDGTILLLAEASIRLAWMGAVFLLAASIPEAARALRRAGWRSFAPWVAVGVVAVALRLLVEPRLVHENRHGEMMYLSLLGDGHMLHGAAWFETYRLMLALGPRLETVFLTSVVLGTLSCVLAGLFAMVLGRAGAREGLAAALILALLPVHIRVSASESPLVLAAFLTLASTVAVGFGLRAKRPSLVYSGFLLAAILAQVRPIYMLFPAFLLVLPVVLGGPGKERIPIRRVAGPAALCALLLLPRTATIIFLAAEGDAVSGLSVWTLRDNLLSQAHVVLNPTLFPAALTVLGLLGLGSLSHQDRRAAAWVAALVSLLTCWFLLMQQNLGSILRLQHSFLFLWAVLAARGAFELVNLPRSPAWRLGAAAALATAVAVTALPTARITWHAFDKDIESAWLREEAREALPTSGTLVLPGDRAFHKGQILLYFLPELLPGRGEDWSIVRLAPDGEPPPTLLSAAGDVFYYRGLWAYEFTADELRHLEAPSSTEGETPRANPFFDVEQSRRGERASTATRDSMVRPEILELESRLELEPLPELSPFSFEARPFHRWIVPQREPEIFFGRVLAVDGLAVGRPSEDRGHAHGAEPSAVGARRAAP